MVIFCADLYISFNSKKNFFLQLHPHLPHPMGMEDWKRQPFCADLDIALHS